MIKVFSSGYSPGSVGEEFNRKISEWLKESPQEIIIKDVSSNSNKFGWMLVVIYEVM